MGVIIQTVSRSCCFIFFLLSFPLNSIVINSDLITMCHTMAAVRSLQKDLPAGEPTNTQSANVSKWKQFDSHWWPTGITARIICHYFCTCARDSCQPVCILNGGCTLPPLDRSEKQSRDRVGVVYTDMSNHVFLPALSATHFSKHMVSLPLAPLNKATYNFRHSCYE